MKSMFLKDHPAGQKEGHSAVRRDEEIETATDQVREEKNSPRFRAGVVGLKKKMHFYDV